MSKAPLHSYLCALLLAGAIAVPGAAQADACSLTSPCVATYIQTSDESSPTAPVGINAGNKITVTDIGTGSLHIVTNLLNGWNFVSTGASGNAGSFAFGLSSNLNLSFGANTPANWGPTATNGTWQPTGSGVLAAATDPVAVNAAALSAPGKFSFTNGYGLTFNVQGSGASLAFHTLDFTISAAGLTLASLVSNQLAGGDAGVFFLDVINNNRAGAPTGEINFTLAPVPLPPAALLFGTALVGLGFLRRRRISA
jgi:hypothetical protein